MTDAPRPTVLVSSYLFASPKYPDHTFHTSAPTAYADSVRMAGGTPLIAPPLDTDEQVMNALRACDAVLMVGGPDLLPHSYGQEAHPRLEPMHPRRNDSDLRLARLASASNKPLMGICGGLQTVNVALGGTLHQHIPEMPELVGEDDHTLKIPNCNRHRIKVDPDSRLARIIFGGQESGDGSVEVNSYHHQAVDRVGHGLRVVARSLTGVIEALEGDDPDRFLVLTQWHPERMAVRVKLGDAGAIPPPDRLDQLAIFEALIGAART